MSVATANTVRIPITTITTTVCTRATARDPPMFRRVIPMTSTTAKNLVQARSCWLWKHRRRVTAERHGDHARDHRVRGQTHPAEDPGDVPVAIPAAHVLDHPGRRGEAGSHLRERITLQDRDDAGEREGEPHRGARDLARRAEQREDSGAHHRADTDERGLRTVSPRGGRARHRRVGHSRVGHRSSVVECR